MIYVTPQLEQIDHDVLGLLHEQRNTLRYQVNQGPVRWVGFLRRNTFARAVRGSNSIEGYDANLSDAVEIIDDQKPETVEDETRFALLGYRNAMTYILRIYDDPHAKINLELIRSLHFMMLSYDITKHPGQWRPGTVIVVDDRTGDTMYEGPPSEQVPQLMDEFARQLVIDKDLDATVKAAMAHLNLTMIHPFKDGNGRMARALQTMLLTRDGVLSPVFCSIEEWLGRNTQAYYDVLSSIGQGRWNPAHDALPWVRFCLRAHYQQAATIMKRNAEIGRVWEEIHKIIKSHGFLDRMEMALIDAAFGFKVRSNRYREEGNLSDVVASRDLKKLCDAGLLRPIGEKRGRYYIAEKPLLEIRSRFKDDSKSPDPYEIAGRSRQGKLNV
jgi:Fic family protein